MRLLIKIGKKLIKIPLEYSLKIILTTSTLHHKFLIKSLNEISGIEVVVIFVHNKNKKNKYFFKFQKNEYKFEMRKFFNNKSYKIK